MNALKMGCAALLLGLMAGSALAQPAGTSKAVATTVQPPMNDFNQAFYRCDGGLNFMMSYDSDNLAAADMLTNDDGRHYALKRTGAPSGVQFAGGGARFWTDGKTVLVEGTKSSFKNCRTK